MKKKLIFISILVLVVFTIGIQDIDAQGIECYNSSDCPTQEERYCNNRSEACIAITYYMCKNPGTNESSCVAYGGAGGCGPCKYGCEKGYCITNSTCSDGTLYGQCSTIKPKYCDNGTLINYCQICSCKLGYQCQSDGSCVKPIKPPKPYLTSPDEDIDGSVKEQLTGKIKNLDTAPLQQARFALPVSFKIIITDANEEIFININKEGIISLPDSMKKVDLELKTSTSVLNEIKQSSELNIDTIKKYVQEENMTIIPYSMKAQLGTQILEDKLDIELVKNKSYFHRTIIFLISRFVNLFVR